MKRRDPGLAFLEELTDFGIKLGLDKTLFFLRRLGNPHLKIPSILVAGTNGKGSVAKTLSEIVRQAGYRAGLYTSPHLVNVRERICLDGTPIRRLEFYAEVQKLRNLLARIPLHMYPTYFEAMTIIAFDWFASAGAEIIVAEVGMGGRFDATNVLPSFLEVITPVGWDHMQYLGKTLGEIAYEKAGVVKQGSAVVCARQAGEVRSVIESKVAERNARAFWYGTDFRGIRLCRSPEGQEFRFQGETGFQRLHTRLLGRHQIENVCLAVQAALVCRSGGMHIPDSAVEAGVRSAVWPARFQILRNRPVCVLDGAHNPSGIATLLRTLEDIFPGRRFSFLVGILKDKDWRTMLRLLSRKAEAFLLTQPETSRAEDFREMAAFLRAQQGRIPVRCREKTADAYRMILSSRRNWCICGSLYLAGEILAFRQGTGVTAAVDG